ncbi:hypothetical protein CTA2_7038 [Colletotrichum tanaceti]|uniref:BTB domain-containing protein n=1 Tax=Colletotrichum tanaceti TaxID=1306861 RepID=A0A4U6XD33_9PEZI|nr:hypothetical protein CTA2_7038 [Colletotrichum tanaceti]TKW51737.1 hypothetical protein CTA1_10605 [Colletotrichum tanaceti]
MSPPPPRRPMTMKDGDGNNPQDVRILDPYGDLVLRVGDKVEEKPGAYLVCSKALARASIVFAKMLYGSFAERRPSPTGGGAHADRRWTVDLPEDRRQPLRLLLDVAHGRFDRVPDRLDLVRLYELLVARGWMAAVASDERNPLLLAVAYELGDAQTFSKMATTIINECLVDGDGDLVFGYAGDDWKTYSFKLRNMEHLVPPGFIEDVALTRRTILATVFEPFVSLYTTLKDGNRCTNPDSGKRCDSILLGSLIRSFAAHRVDLTAPDPATAYRDSVLTLQALPPRLKLYTAHSHSSHSPPSQTLMTMMNINYIMTTASAAGLTTRPAVLPRLGSSGSLSACEQALQSDLREVVERSLLGRGGMKFVQPKHRAHLQRQAAKTGLPCPYK